MEIIWLAGQLGPWGLLVPKVSHWLALIPGIGKGRKAHAAVKREVSEDLTAKHKPGIGGGKGGGEGFNLVTGWPTGFTWLAMLGALPINAKVGGDKEGEHEQGGHLNQTDNVIFRSLFGMRVQCD